MNDVEKKKKLEELYNVFVAKIELNRLTNIETSALLTSVFLTFLNNKELKETLRKAGLDVDNLSTEEILEIQAVWTREYFKQNGDVAKRRI